MPIFSIGGDLHYFAHVPKCGGTSVESYLTERFGPLGFLEKGRYRIPMDLQWNRTSGDHVPVEALHRLIPADWLVSSFAVVRHPVRRLISAFFFARDITHKVPAATDFNIWAVETLARIPQDPYLFGGHVRPQTALVPDGSRIFRLEDGLDPIVPYLDALAGNAKGPRQITSKNVGKWRSKDPAPVPTDEVLAMIARVYGEDFARFGYDTPEDVDTARALPDLPLLAATGRPPAPRRRPLMARIYRRLRTSAERS
jgi:hypothetical protein